MATLRVFLSNAIALALLGTLGCSSATPPIAVPAPPVNLFRYQLDLPASYLLDSTTGRFVLWVSMIGDSTLHSAVLDSFKTGSGLIIYQGNIQLSHSPDSIVGAILSVETSSMVAVPSHIMMTGNYDHAQNFIPLSSQRIVGIDSLSNAQAYATFTTKSVDTNLARSEFYFIRLIDGVATSSISGLPEAPAGWLYGIWVLDSNFYPHHQFYYGDFDNPDSSNVTATNSDYPFPGGYNAAPLNDPGASLIVTLEPSFNGSDPHPTGPSPFTILSGQLSAFIYFDDTLRLQNIWNSQSGSLTVH